MSATESKLSKETEAAKEEPKEETAAERLERELAELRESGVLEKQLPTISRSTFEQLSPRAQMDFMRSGGTLTNNPATAKVPLPEGAIRRSAFDRLTPAATIDFITKGGTIVDDDTVIDDKSVAD